MKIEKTYQEVLTFNESAIPYVRGKAETLLTKSIYRMLKQTDIIVNKYLDLADDIDYENAVVDEKTKALIKDEKGGYQYTIEGRKNKKAALKILNETKVEIHQRIIPENNSLVETLTEQEKYAFQGFVIDEIKDEE